MKPAAFEYFRLVSLDEASAILAVDDDDADQRPAAHATTEPETAL
jgi:hypothetical protein